jgi:hypothetical protein
MSRYSNELDEDFYFEQKLDVVVAICASTDQNIAVTLRQLTQGIAADSRDEDVRLSESKAICLKWFCSAAVNGLSSVFLGLPNKNKLHRCDSECVKLGFPWAIGCCDCASCSGTRI